MPVKIEKSEPLVITFRDHHNAYTEEDGAKIIRHLEPNTLWHKFCQIAYGMIVIHYFLWFIPMLFMVYLPWIWGYPLVSIILLAIYLPTYFNRDELKHGRPWEWLRQHRMWTYLQVHFKYA